MYPIATETATLKHFNEKRMILLPQLSVYLKLSANEHC